MTATQQASSTQTLDDTTSRRTEWARALFAMGLGLVLLGAIFRNEIQAAIRTWETSTAYNHSWLVLPLAGWLAWTRRERLAELVPAPSPWFALLALPLTFAWLVAERLGIMEGRQLMALALFQVLILSILGWRVCRAMAAPLAYLVFLVPFGAFVAPTLQNATAAMIDRGLDLLGITHYRDGLIIETTAGLFYVAEACAGLRFVIAALAFGALYAFLMYRSPWRRLVVLLLALVVPVLANGLRALGIVTLGVYLGSAEAVAADHVIYGWGFSSLIILLLIVAGWPFRESTAVLQTMSATTRLPAWPVTVLAAATLLTLSTAAMGPAVAVALNRSADRLPQERVLQLAAPAGCETKEAELRCGNAVVTGRLLILSPHVTWASISSAHSRLIAGSSDEDLTFRVATRGSALWLGRHLRGGGAVAVAMWLDGKPTAGGLRARVAQALDSLTGVAAPVIAVVTLRQDRRATDGTTQVQAVLESVLKAQTISPADIVGMSQQ